MADYTCERGDIGVAPFATASNTEDKVTFKDNVTEVEIVSDGGADVWYTIDNSPPTIPTAGASTRCYRLPAGTPSVDSRPMFASVDVIRFISTGVAKVSVQKHDL